MKRKGDWSTEELREFMRSRGELEVGCSMGEWRKKGEFGEKFCNVDVGRRSAETRSGGDDTTYEESMALH